MLCIAAAFLRTTSISSSFFFFPVLLCSCCHFLMYLENVAGLLFNIDIARHVFYSSPFIRVYQRIIFVIKLYCFFNYPVACSHASEVYCLFLVFHRGISFFFFEICKFSSQNQSLA